MTIAAAASAVEQHALRGLKLVIHPRPFLIRDRLGTGSAGKRTPWWLDDRSSEDAGLVLYQAGKALTKCSLNHDWLFMGSLQNLIVLELPHDLDIERVAAGAVTFVIDRLHVTPSRILAMAMNAIQLLRLAVAAAHAFRFQVDGMIETDSAWILLPATPQAELRMEVGGPAVHVIKQTGLAVIALQVPMA